jgi:stage III sporulation protein AB
LLGSLLILAGCAGGIVCWLEGERRKQAMMEEWIRLFVRWDYGLRSEHIRLYTFFGQYETGRPEMAEFLTEVCRRLQQNCYPSGQQVWQQVLKEQQKKISLRGEAGEILLQAGDAFFCGSSRESLHTIRICRERMEQCLVEARGEFAGKRKVYIPAGMLGGAVLIILLI